MIPGVNVIELKPRSRYNEDIRHILRQGVKEVVFFAAPKWPKDKDKGAHGDLVSRALQVLTTLLLRCILWITHMAALAFDI